MPEVVRLARSAGRILKVWGRFVDGLDSFCTGLEKARARAAALTWTGRMRSKVNIYDETLGT